MRGCRDAKNGGGDKSNRAQRRGEQLVKSENQMGVFLWLPRRPRESLPAARPPMANRFPPNGDGLLPPHLTTRSFPATVLLQSPATPLLVVVFFLLAGQDLAGETLTRPFHARPQKRHLAGVNDYQSNGQVTCSQQEPRSLHLSASHFPCPPFISLQVNYSSRMMRRAHIYSTDQKKTKTPTTPKHFYRYNNLRRELNAVCRPDICRLRAGGAAVIICT